MYKEDLTLDNIQWLICHKTKPSREAINFIFELIPLRKAWTNLSLHLNSTAVVLLQGSLWHWLIHEWLWNNAQLVSALTTMIQPNQQRVHNTASVTWYTCLKLPRTKILQNTLLIFVVLNRLSWEEKSRFLDELKFNMGLLSQTKIIELVLLGEVHRGVFFLFTGK